MSLLEEDTADSLEFIDICGKSKFLFIFEGVFNLSL